MKRPVVAILIFYIIGIIIGQYVSFEKGIAVVLFSLSILGVSVIMVIKYKWKMLIFLFCFFLMGFYSIGNSNKDKFDKVLINGEERVSTGTVIKTGLTSSGSQKIYMMIDDIDGKKENFKVCSTVFIKKPILVGEKLKITGKIEKLSPQYNEGAYNEFSYERCKKVQCKIVSTKVVHLSISKNIRYYLAMTKDNIARVYDGILPPTESGILKAMILGDGSFLDPNLKVLFSKLAVYHYLVISGLHLAIISSIIFGLIKRFFNAKIASVMTILFVCLYATMTGLGVATVRATIIITIYLSSNLLYRKKDFLNSIAIAALIILLYEPMFLFNIGFILTFSAVISIGVLNPSVERLFNLTYNRFPWTWFITKNKYITEYIIISITVMVFNLPFLIYFFYKVPTYYMFANLLIAPSSGILIAFAFFLRVLGLVFLPLANFFAGTIYFILKFYEGVVNFFGNLPYGQILIGRVHIFHIVIYFVLVLLFIKTLQSFNDKFYFYEKILYNLVAVSVVAISVEIFWPVDKPLNISFLYVGQGESTVVSNGDYNFLIDGGGLPAKAGSKNSGFYDVKPYLDFSGTQSLDGVFLTNFDSNRATGVLEILNIEKVDKLFLPFGNYEENKIYKNIIDTCHNKNIPIEYLKAGDEYKINDKFYFEAISPSENQDDFGEDQSLVLSVSFNDVKTLLPSNISGDEEQLLISNKNVKSDILEIGNNGSKNSSTMEFLKKVSPKVAVISSGINSKIDSDVLNRLKTLNIPEYTTGKNGRIKFTIKGQKIFIDTKLSTQ